jgi:hypothetical protein
LAREDNKPTMNGDDVDKWTEATLDGWNPSEHGWGPPEFDDAESGPPLSAADLRKAHEDLAQWHLPIDFRRAVHNLFQRCRGPEFKKPEQFLLNAWTLARFVRHKPVGEIRLAVPSVQWPDGYVKIDRTIENVEVTSAMMPGREMWKEHQIDNGTWSHDPVENWVKRADAIPGALEEAIRRKAKRYSSRMWLVVYLNIPEWGIRQVEIERAIAEIKQRYANSFDQLFVLWKDKLL